jgi:hypothetical protein
MGRDMGLEGWEFWGGVETIHCPPVEEAFEFPCGCRKWVGRFLACMEHEGKALLVPAFPSKNDTVRVLNTRNWVTVHEDENGQQTFPSDFNFGPSTLDTIYDEEWRDSIPPAR